MAKIGSMHADLTLQSAAFMRDMKKSADAVASNTARMNQSMRQVERATAGVQRAFGQLRAGATVLVGALAVRQFTEFAKKAVDFGSMISDSADSVGLTTQEFQQFQLIAAISGVKIEKTTTALQFFAKTIGEARAGTGKMVEGLKDTDKAFLLQIMNAKSTGDALALYLDKMAKTSNATDRARLATVAFGRAGVAMVNVLGDGISGFNAMKARVLALGLILEEKLVRHLDAVGDRLDIFKRAFDVGFARGVVVELAGSFQITKENIESARIAGENFGRLVGASIRGLAAAAALVGRYLREIAATLAGLIALGAAGYFIAAGAAVVKFAQALLAAGKAGLILEAIMSRTALGLLAKIAVAVGVAALVYQSFGGDTEKAARELENLTKQLDSNGKNAELNAIKMRKLIETEKLHFAGNQKLAASLLLGRDAYEAVKRETEVLNEAKQKEIDLTSRSGQEWLRYARFNKIAEDQIKKAAEVLNKAKQAGQELGGAIGTAFESAIINGNKLSDVLKSLAQDIQRLILRAALTQPLQQMLGNFFQNNSSILSFFRSVTPGVGNLAEVSGSAGVAHAGGIVGRTAFPMRAVDTGIFRGAPRFARGSLPFNIGGNEVPIIAHKNEVIGSPGQMMQAFGGARVGVDVNVYVNDDGTLGAIARQSGREGGAEAADVRVRTFSSNELPYRLKQIEKRPRVVG